MPKMIKGYFTDSEGKTTEHEMYAGDLHEACAKFPKEWSKSPPKSSEKTKASKKAK